MGDPSAFAAFDYFKKYRGFTLLAFFEEISPFRKEGYPVGKTYISFPG